MTRASLILACLLFSGPVRAQPANSFAGTWASTFGPMILTQEGKKVQGFYTYSGNRCPLRGEVVGAKLTFIYEEPKVKGEGWFELAADGKSFTGKWRPQGALTWAVWKGERVGARELSGFQGLWSTTYGRMRLLAEGTRIQGIYGPGGQAIIHGKVEGRRLLFAYEEPGVRGEGWFELSVDSQSFRGKWREAGKTAWQDWVGRRVAANAGKVWLVVLEANWEKDLSDKEYQFGTMLRAFFARSAAVQVRHRFFTDSASLARWCREVAYLAEPVVLCIATHGSPQGVAVGGKTVGASELAAALRYGANIRLLHFSACQLLKDRLGSEMTASLGQRAFPISGYRTSVDWAASAVIEFMYFDLILMRGLSPQAASEQVAKLMPFSGDQPISGAVLRPAGFRLILPHKAYAK